MRIVWATDGSPGALAAGELLARLALGEADEIVLLRTAPDAGAAGGGFEPEQAALAGSAAAVRTEVRAGAPAAAILDFARESGADLLTVGALGASGLARFLVGGVTERVLRHAVSPVLVARPLRHDLRMAVVGVDPAPTAASVVDAAAGFPLPPATELHLCTVLAPIEAVAGAAPAVWAALSGEIEEVLQGTLREAEDRLRELAQGIRSRGRPVSAEIDRGDPVTHLIAAVERQQADLLILGSHGQAPVDRFFLGSVCERAARHAQSSVLVVRTPG